MGNWKSKANLGDPVIGKAKKKRRQFAQKNTI
jgi:hypothetical protein